MKKIFFFLIFLSILGSAQSHRFIYEYDFVPNLKKPDSLAHEVMRLNITKDFSEFLPENMARQDSVIMKNIALKQNYDMMITANTPSSQSYKDYAKNETFVRAEIGFQQVIIKLKTLPKWKLFPEKKKIGVYVCQKATANFGGRNWTAWFSAALPFQEGPYIFKNLPGLIIDIEDDTKSHHFALISNHNSENGKSNRFAMGNVLALSEEKFVTAWRKYRQNPVPPSLQMQDRGILIENNEEVSGKFANEILEIKKDIDRHNNPILLNLYQ